MTALSVISGEDRPSSSIVYITPEMAERWLAANKVNRHVRDPKVAKFARDMANNRWQLTGQGIIFSKSGKLIDGQHRLLAIIASGCTVATFVMRGVNDAAQAVIDTGTSRTAADELHMNGHVNASLLASVARRLVANSLSQAHCDGVTNTEIHEFIKKNPEVSEAVKIARRYAKTCDIQPSTMGVASWWIAEVHGWFAADGFFCAAAEKTLLSPGDPVLAMTAFFAEQRRGKRRLSLSAQLSVIIRAFNYRYAGKPWKTVRLASSTGGEIPVPAVAS